MGGIYGGRGEGQKLAQMSLNKSMLKRTFISLQENIQNYMKNRFIIIIIIIIIVIIIIIIINCYYYFKCNNTNNNSA